MSKDTPPAPVNLPVIEDGAPIDPQIGRISVQQAPWLVIHPNRDLVFFDASGAERGTFALRDGHWEFRGDARWCAHQFVEFVCEQLGLMLPDRSTKPMSPIP